MSRHLIYLIFTWIHMLAAMAWIGGMLFLTLVLVPVLRKKGDRALMVDLIRTTGNRFKSLGWTLLGILTATGLVNMHFRSFFGSGEVMKAVWTSPMGHVMITKLVVVGVILLLAVSHDFLIGPRASEMSRTDPGSERTEKWRKAASWLGRVNLLLSLVVVALAIMIVRGIP
jgi:putative copper resistance protein D